MAEKENPFAKFGKREDETIYSPEGEMGPPTSTITGEPTSELPANQRPVTGHEQQTYLDPKEEFATAVRNVPPIAAGFATGGSSFLTQLLYGGVSSGLSEITARQIESAANDPEYNKLVDDLKGGGVAAGLDMFMTSTLHGAGKFVKSMAKKAFLPDVIPDKVKTAQGVLGQFETPEARSWFKSWKETSPFSLTFRQLSDVDRGLVYQLDKVARSGFFSTGRMADFDLRNVKQVQKVIDDYVGELADKSTGPQFGAFLQEALGYKTTKFDKRGALFQPVEAVKTYLYDVYDRALIDAGATVNLSGVRDTIQKLKSPKLLEAYKNVRTKITDAGEAFSLLPPTLTAEGWDKIDATDADKVVRLLGKEAQSTNADKAKAAKDLLKLIKKPFDATVESVPGAATAKKTADLYYGHMKDMLHNGTIETIRKVIGRKPSGVISLFDPSVGNVAQKYESLKKMREGFYSGMAAPSVTKKGLAAGAQRTIEGKTGIDALWEEGVVKPLRHRFIYNPNTLSDAGEFLPDKVINQIKKVRHDAPEMLTDLFGGEAQVKQIEDLLNTLSVVSKESKGTSVIIQLAQAGAVGTLGVGATAIFSDDPKTYKVGGALAILLAPTALARVFTNARLIRSLTDGIAESSKLGRVSISLAMTFRKIAQMQIASDTYRNAESQDAQNFYFGPMKIENEQ
jgi:hypothetical protein